MASNFLSRSIAMKVEILLVNPNFWLAYGKEKSTANTPVEAFLEMVSEGCPEMEAILLKATCPYLFKIWSQPLFRVDAAYDLERPSQSDAIILKSLEETVLGHIFSYLSEEDLARSVSRVCVRFRCSIASRNHVDVLLGKAMSSDLREVFARAQKQHSTASASSLADRLIDLSEVLSDAKVQYAAAERNLLNGTNPTKVDSAIISTFTSVPDCPRRLDQLASALTAKASLGAEKARVRAILASRSTFMEVSSQGRQALLHLLGAVQAYGQTFGSKPRHSHNSDSASSVPRRDTSEEENEEESGVEWSGFTFASLKDLPEIRSRFHRPFTPAVAILLHVLEQHRGMTLRDLERGLKEIESCLITLCGATDAPVFHVLAQASAVVERIRAKGKLIRSAEAESPFHQRLAHLFQLLEPACRELEAMIKAVHQDLRALMMWLFPERADSEEQSFIVKVYGADGELKCLFDFVQHCLALLGRPSSESCAAVRELAIATTALESAAIAKNASQKGLSRQQSAPAASEGFTRARSAVARTLDSTENIKQERTERMSQVLREVLPEEEQERRRTELQRSLQLRLPSQPPQPPSGEESSVLIDDEEEEEEAESHAHSGADAVGTSGGIVERVEDIEEEEEEAVREVLSSALEELVSLESPKVEVADASSTALLVRSPQSIVASSPLRGAESMPPLSLADFKTTKLWNWVTFKTLQASNIWSELAQGRSEFVIPMGDEEERVLQRLFSRGPEVAFTVSQTHQKLKHFTSEDFSGMRSTRSFKRDQSASLLDTGRTLRAVESIPVVAKVREMSTGSPSSPSSIAAQSPSAGEEEQEEAPAGLILPLSRVLELKKEGKLASIRLKPNQLEGYLSEEDFAAAFKMPRAEFNKLAGWKRDKLKKEVGLF